MKKKINIKINGKKVSCEPGITIMQAAKSAGIDIPGICNHADFHPKANCRLCMVEIKGRKGLVTSCSTEAEEGMEVVTENERINKSRNLNIELLFAEHIEKCASCIWRYQCSLLGFAEKYKILITRFQDRKKKRKTYKFANAVEIDGSQCIDCRNCIDACSLLQKIDYLELKGKGTDQEVVPVSKKGFHCILCGQCAVHCPVSAAQEQAQWQEVEKAIKDPDKVVVAQFAPSIRVSIGEDFGQPHGQIMTEQLVAGLRQLGFDHVFDVSFAADVTTIVEARELIERITEKKEMPMFTSCCPGWVNYVEFYHPELIPNLTTSRSPQIHGGGLVKTFWAERMNINPRKIVTVSVMPCTAKKYEASRKEMRIDNMLPVDHVITTRELSFLLKKNNINLPKLKKSKADNPLGDYSGAGVIFGSSGGVMESALRTAQYFLCENSPNKACNRKIEFKDVRGNSGIKEAKFVLAGNELRVAVVNGIGNIGHVLENLDKYDYIEVMACPGGCIGGGGQPIPTNNEIREKRIKALYKDDKGKKMRRSYENKAATESLKWLSGRKDLEGRVLHTKYSKKTKY